MKTKINKLVKLAAAGLFIVALAINVKVTLDDPFVMLSEQAIATGTFTGTVTGTVTGGVPGSDGSDGAGYKEEKPRVHCNTTKTEYVRNEDTDLVKYGGEVKAEADWKLFTLSGKGYGDASNAEKITNYTKKVIKANFWADKYLCPPGTASSCTEYDPCSEVRTEF